MHLKIYTASTVNLFSEQLSSDQACPEPSWSVQMPPSIRSKTAVVSYKLNN